MKIITLQELTKMCLKERDKGNGKKVVMVRNNTKFGNYTPILAEFKDKKEEINKNIKTSSPENFILLGWKMSEKEFERFIRRYKETRIANRIMNITINVMIVLLIIVNIEILILLNMRWEWGL